ncbi:MAG TPA: hypothetical protein VFU05_18410 [Cyclobacteriaceae bacterium]|nr:hypothetical protein [Cyclobacteriaceae bacterium]
MKKVRNLTGMLMMVILAAFIASDSLAQGRGHGNNNPGRGHDKDNHPGKGHGKHRGSDWDYGDRHDRNNTYAHYDNRNDRYSHGRYVTYNYNRTNRHWAPVYGYRYNTRYIYYRDYNVYYDCHRDVFVTWTGRNWAISTRIPVVLAQVEFRRATVVGVDYWDDDFDFYLTRRRPAYVSIQASF